MNPVTVALRNDYEVVVLGLERMLEPYRDQVRVLELDSKVDPLRTVDVTLYDTFSQAEADGEGISDLVKDPHVGRVVVYSWNSQPELVEQALEVGCAGYVDKSATAEELVEAIVRVAAGEQVTPEPVDAAAEEGSERSPEQDDLLDRAAYPGKEHGLSAREAEIVGLITQGLTNEQITVRCYLSINTVKTYIRSAYQKIGVTRRAEAVRWGMEHGMLPRPDREIRD